MSFPSSSTIFISAAVLFFCSCSVPEIKKEAPETNEVTEGSSFRIILPEDHTTGYLWQLQKGFDETLLENTHTVWHGNEKGIYFDFKAKKSGEHINNSGQTVLTFINRKYTDTLNVKSFIIKLIRK